MSYDAFCKKLEENTFVAFIMKHPVAIYDYTGLYKTIQDYIGL